MVPLLHNYDVEDWILESESKCTRRMGKNTPTCGAGGLSRPNHVDVLPISRHQDAGAHGSDMATDANLCQHTLVAPFHTK